MIDVEEQLRASLRSYAAHIEPGPSPSDSLVPVVHEPRHRQPGPPLLAAAAAIVVLLVPALWFALERDTQPVESSPPATAPGTGTWTATAPMPLAPRKFPSVLWTGDEFLVWGGEVMNSGFADGAAYDPGTDRWRTMASNEAVRPGGNAVWTGDRMVVLSGAGGQAYDPGTDSWSSLPELPPGDASPGFTDAVHAGGRLYGLGIWPEPNSGSARISAWVLDVALGRWTKVVDDQYLDGTKEIVSIIDDPFATHWLVATDDGFAVWDGGSGGWRYSTTDGWLAIPANPPDDVPLVQTLGLVWANGRLAMVGGGRSFDSDDLRVARWGGGGWSPWSVVSGRTVLGAVPVAAGSDIVVLGTDMATGGPSPRRIDLRTDTSESMEGYPLSTVIDQGATWSITVLSG